MLAKKLCWNLLSYLRGGNINTLGVSSGNGVVSRNILEAGKQNTSILEIFNLREMIQTYITVVLDRLIICSSDRGAKRRFSF